MRINIDRQTGILSLPSDPVVLEDITTSGQYRYLVKYNVDVARAIRSKAFVVKIHVSNNPLDNRDVPGFTRLNSNQVIQNLLNRQAERVEVNRSFAQNYIKTIISDITAVVPNNKTKELTASSLKKEVSVEPFLFQNSRFQLVRASELTQKNISQPVLQTPLFQPIPTDVAPALPPQELGFNLVMQYGRDPSSVSNRTNLYVDTERVQAGILQRPSGIAREALQGASIGSIQPSFGLLNTILGERRNKPSDQSGLADNDFTHILVTEPTNTKTIAEDLVLNISDLGDQFYLIYSLQDSSGVEVERTSILVHHSRNVAIFTMPITPPFLSVVAGKGFNRLEIKQLDPNGAGVYVYRRIIDTHTAITEADYVQIVKLPLRVQDGAKWYIDESPGMRPVIYRVIAYNRSELKSHDFTSTVIKPIQKLLGVQATSQQKRLFVSINLKILARTVQVELNDIPTGVLALRVYRRDLSRHETLEESTQIGNTVYMPALPGKNSKYYVTDTNPVDSRVYEYSVLLIFKDGTELWSTTRSSIQFNPVLNNIISTTSSPIQATNTGDDLDVEFTLGSVVADGQVDQIRKALEQQGILGFFQDDITQNREKLQSLIAYQVKRNNLTTGEHSDMGVFIGTQFSDRTIGKNLGVAPPKEGCVYEYTITTHFRSAQSLISTFTTTITNTTNPSKTYSFKPSKWQHPVTLNLGNIVTTTSLKRNHSSSDFTFGTVGDILHLRIDLSTITPSIHDATVKTLGKGKVLVQWNLKGSNKKIDHFIVTKEEMGMKTVVGKTHALADSNLQFLDSSCSLEKPCANPTRNINHHTSELETSVIYHITPVFFDYTHGASIKTPPTITRKMR
jgi:hypothetical protein